MKKYLFKTIQTLLVFSLAFTLTNCGNIDNPLEEISGSGSVPPSVVEEAKVLGAALEEGATVTIKYTIDGNNYTATFKKNGDNYELVSNTAGARALTRGSDPTYTPSLSVSADGAKLLLSVIQDGTTDVVLEAYMDIKTGETCVFQTKEGGFDVSAFKIGDEQPAVTNPYNKQVLIQGRGANSRAFTRYAYETYAYINYKEGETWKDVYDRYKDFNHSEFAIEENGYLSMTIDTYTFYLVYSLSTPLTYAKSTELVGKNGEDACETYLTTLSDPNSPLANVTTSDIGKLIGADGNIYASAAAATEASTTAVAMIAYVGSGSDCEHGLAIQLNSNPEQKDWANAKTYAEGLTAVPGGTWRLPSKDDWQNMFLGCAKSDDASSASDDMNPIAGFKEKIAAAGVTWQSVYYWSSTESEPGGLACDVHVDLDGDFAYANFYELATDLEDYVLGCLAF